MSDEDGVLVDVFNCWVVVFVVVFSFFEGFVFYGICVESICLGYIFCFFMVFVCFIFGSDYMVFGVVVVLVDEIGFVVFVFDGYYFKVFVDMFVNFVDFDVVVFGDVFCIIVSVFGYKGVYFGMYVIVVNVVMGLVVVEGSYLFFGKMKISSNIWIGVCVYMVLCLLLCVLFFDFLLGM